MEKPDRSVESAMEVLNKILDILEKYPDLRVGQIIVNSCLDPESLYDLENNELLAYLRNFEHWERNKK